MYDLGQYTTQYIIFFFFSAVTLPSKWTKYSRSHSTPGRIVRRTGISTSKSANCKKRRCANGALAEQPALQPLRTTSKPPIFSDTFFANAFVDFLSR